MDEKVLKLLADGLRKKNSEAIKAYKNLQKIAQGLGEEAEKAKVILNKIQSYLTLKAARGTKLNYFKSLKNQCAEDEEVVYFKKGGLVSCGCKKKEDGGEIAKAQNGTAVLKFKNDYNSKKVLNSEKDYLEGRGDHKINNKNQSVQQKFKNDYSSKKVKDSENDYFNGTADHEVNKKEYKPLKQHVPTKKQQTTGTVKKIEYKKLDNKFPEKKACGSKLKKHLLGGSLNGIPFMLQGTPKGGIEKSDNTRVLHVPNNGEGIYEKTPTGYGDFLPLVGTWRAAQRIDKREPNASYGDLIMNGAMDLLGARMVGPVVKAAGKANRIARTLKSRGFVPGSKEGIYIKQGATGTINRASGNVKLIPTVDYYNVAMQPMIQTLRVPATAPFK